MNNLINIENQDGTLTEKNGHVYIIEKPNGNIKIGKSRNPQSRFCQISQIGGFEIKRTYVSEKCSNYSEIEALMHSIFSSKRVIGEWFKVNFDVAVKKLATQTFEPLEYLSPQALARWERGIKEQAERSCLLIARTQKEELDRLEKMLEEKEEILINSVNKKIEEGVNKMRLSNYIKSSLGEDREDEEADLVKQRVLMILNGEAWQDIPYEKLISNMRLIDESIRTVKSFRTKKQVSLFDENII